jgi:hypothetical protein
MNKIEGWSRDGRAKKYTNKICRRDNHIHDTSLRLIFEIDDSIKKIMRWLIDGIANPLNFRLCTLL